MKKQLITYSIDLSNPDHPYIGQFTINMILLVPSKFIATDIKTGFPQLMQALRQNFDHYIREAFESFQSQEQAKILRPLEFIDQFMMIIEPRLRLFIKNHDDIDLNSLNVEIFAEILTNHSNINQNC